MEIFKKNGLNKIKKDGRSIQREVNKKIFTFITAGLGLVVGLAWNDAIKELIEYLFPLEKGNLWAKFAYAIILTLVLVLISVYAAKIFLGEEDQTKED